MLEHRGPKSASRRGNRTSYPSADLPAGSLAKAACCGLLNGLDCRVSGPLFRAGLLDLGGLLTMPSRTALSSVRCLSD